MASGKLLTKAERQGTGTVSFISWRRLAEVLERAGECSPKEFIDGFTLEGESGLKIYRGYK